MLRVRVIGPAAVAAIAAGVAASPASAGYPLPPGCARQAPTQFAPPAWKAARNELAPAGADAIRLCRYSGLNARPPMILIRSVLITDPQLVSRLVARLDALPPPPLNPVACPLDDGSQIVVKLAYPNGRRVRISVGLTGCQVATNGSVTRVSTPRLVAELERLAAG